MHLLSWHGTIICQPDANGTITHQPLPLDADAPAPMEFEGAKLTDGSLLRHQELGFLRLEDAAGGIGFHLAREGYYICAESYARPLRFNRTEASGWESFLPITAQDFADLQHILRYRWIVRDTRRVIRRAATRFADNFVLRIGEFALALADGIATYIGRRAATGLPDWLIVPLDGEPIDLVIAEPRSSALIETAIWPVRARRTAELVTLAVHRHMTGLEPSQEVFERDTNAVLSNRGAAALSDLLEQLDPAAAAAAPAGAPAPMAEEPVESAAARSTQRDEVLMAWAMREMMPWLLKPVPYGRASYEFDALNTTEDWAIVYDFADGDVTMRAKPDAVVAVQDEATRDRALHYLDLFKATSRLLPAGFKATLCAGVADAIEEKYGVPVFCFQKAIGDTSILLPDIDFLLSDYHLDPQYSDLRSYDEKLASAVFAGSTTGGTITPEVARAFGLPRLRAAKFFSDSKVVDFRLPGITQCSSEEAETILKAYKFCQVPELTWQQQLRHRFVISMDGNGATCSRVAIALRSNSVLMKYNSDKVLFYFGGLQPWLHYVPIANDLMLERVVALESLMPDPFRHIAENGRIFAETYLTEEAIHRYTADLLLLYARAFAGEEGSLVALATSHLRRSAPAAASTIIVGHIQNRGDITCRADHWLGDSGSTLAIEGFSITLGEGLPPDGFFYQAVLGDGTLSEPFENDEYCGTRGENQPIFGICVTAGGRFGEAYEVAYEASFTDGSESGPCGSGTLCKANTRVPLEAFRISITERVPAAREAADIGHG